MRTTVVIALLLVIFGIGGAVSYHLFSSDPGNTATENPTGLPTDPDSPADYQPAKDNKAAKDARKETVRAPSASDIGESLAALEQKIGSAAEKYKHSIVRISWINGNNRIEESLSGVIITTDGYVATCAYNPSFELSDLPPGKSVSVHLSDGRTVAGVAVGSTLEWGFGLIKITQGGEWTVAATRSSADVKPGDICLALGYPSPVYKVPYDREPSLHVGCVTMMAEQRWLGSSCRLGSDGGSGLFDLQGKLLGIYNPGIGGFQVGPTADIIQKHWKELAARKPLEKKSAPVEAKAVREPAEKQEPPLPTLDDPSVAPAVAKAKQVTVRIEPEQLPARVSDYKEAWKVAWSGVVVTADGYIATCAHHLFPPGTHVTIRFADGRAVPGKILGSDWMLDIGLAKIAALGPWPHSQWGSAADVKSGDICIAPGYPGHLQTKDKTHLEVLTGMITDDQWFVPWQLQSSCYLVGGNSGGGLFDTQGRLLAVHSGGYKHPGPTWHRTSDLFTRHWDFLASGKSLGSSDPFDQSSTADAFRKAVEQVPPITVEVLGDGKRRCLGTIVSGDGYVLAKASELYGSISCRLTDGRVLPATVGKISREHDLALLKINVNGLPETRWSERERVPGGSFVSACRFRGPPQAVGVVTQATHGVPRVPGWLILGQVKDAKDGVEVSELRGFWQMYMPIRNGDVIVQVEGHPTPNLKALEEVAKRDATGMVWEMTSVNAGDPVRVTVRREGKNLELRFPLLSTSWDMMGQTSPRRCAFPAIFETDATISMDACGGPIVDRSGEVVGIAIAKAGEYRLYVIPTAVARKVFDQLRD